METILRRNTLRLERDGAVGKLWLDRPEKLNAFTIEMWDEMAELGAELVADPGDLRALVVIGEGRAFSSGIDTAVFTSGAFGGGKPEDRPAPIRHEDPFADAVLRTQDAYSWLETAPFATIAAVRGFALGAGLQLALACDLRVFARGAIVGLLELQYGIMPDLGGTQRLPRLVGPGKAKELVFTGAKIDAEEAHRIGIAEQLVDDADLDAAVDALATRIAGRPPLAVRGAKAAINAATEVSVADGLRVEAERQSVCLRSSDMAEAIGAFVEGREPNYRAK
ncbi:MAG TPA: enoyl-CoA hydratase/isomerase family protein [Acidimicrobiia bacterium]|nr:enoyl-CoA hydratase/isomerase family protein [Acidimicrobiia bacterium]